VRGWGAFLKVVTGLLTAVGIAVLQGCASPGGSVGDGVFALRNVRIVEVFPGYAGIIYAMGRIVSEDEDGVRYDVYLQNFDASQVALAPVVGDVCTITFTWNVMKDDYDPVKPATNGEAEQKRRKGRSATCGAKTYDLLRFSWN